MLNKIAKNVAKSGHLDAYLWWNVIRRIRYLMKWISLYLQVTWQNKIYEPTQAKVAKPL